MFFGCASQKVTTDNQKDNSISGPRPVSAEKAKLASDYLGQDIAVMTADSSNQGHSSAPLASAEHHFTLAQAYSTEGKVDEAIEEYKLALVYDPNSALVYGRLAAEYVRKGSAQSALDACREALKIKPDFTDARLMMAGLLANAQEFAPAITEYQKILKQEPHHEEAAIFLAQTHLEADQAEPAIKSLRAFLKANPQSAAVWYYLGRAEARLDHFKPAVTAYEKALEINESFTQAALALAFLLEAKDYKEQAISRYKAIFDHSGDVSAAQRLAAIYLKGGKYREAIPYLEALQSSDPEDINTKVKLALAFMELKQYPKSLELFKGILAKNPDSDRINYYVASIHEEQKNFTKAIEHLKKIPSESRFFQDSVLHVTHLLKTTGSPEIAYEYISGIIQKEPKFATFHVFKASLEEESEKFDDALKTLTAGLELFPDDDRMTYFLGTLYDRKGNTAKALELMEQILKANPDHVDALNYVGYNWTVQGIRLSDAEKLIRRALSQKPENGFIRDSLGWNLFTQGKHAEALVELEKAILSRPNESIILEHLADIYLHFNLREKALARYQQAIQFADDAKTKESLTKKIEDIRTRVAGESGSKTSPSHRTPATQP